MTRRTAKPSSDAFTQEAVNRVTAQGMSRAQVARDLGVRIDTRARWGRAAAPAAPVPAGVAHPPPQTSRGCDGKMTNDGWSAISYKKRSASSRRCPVERPLSVHRQPREPVSRHRAVSGLGGWTERFLRLADTHTTRTHHPRSGTGRADPDGVCRESAHLWPSAHPCRPPGGRGRGRPHTCGAADAQVGPRRTPPASPRHPDDG